MNQRHDSPVLLIIFNRPETTRKVFEAIRKARPRVLYVSADAARQGNGADVVACAQAREIVKEVDWTCEVHYRFLEENLGCGFGVSSAISWAFEKEDRLIILEDDCVPSLPFFDFCSYCLDKYANDTRVWCVSGRSQHQNHPVFSRHDYVFSRYMHSWGWATWKRCWSHFDISMASLPEFCAEGGFRNVLVSKQEAELYDKLYSTLFHDQELRGHVWDYQWNYNIMSNGGLGIVPARNLIQNIGYYGVHYHGRPTRTQSLLAADDYTYGREPMFIVPNRDYDLYHFRHHIKHIMGRKPLVTRAIDKGLRLVGLYR